MALGPMLEAEFRRPVYINNDGNLFVYGEAIAGFLPYVNGLLETAGNPKRYRNLFGVTLGTGLGGGVVVDGRLLIGDNSIGGEAHLLRNVLDPAPWRGGGGLYPRGAAGLRGRGEHPPADAPDPKTIAEIAAGRAPGDRDVAAAAFQRLGEVAGDALAQGLALIDGLAVIGGGISQAHGLFMPGLVAAINRPYANGDASIPRRLIARAFNMEDGTERAEFARSHVHEIIVPGTGQRVGYDAVPRTAVEFRGLAPVKPWRSALTRSPCSRSTADRRGTFELWIRRCAAVSTKGKPMGFRLECSQEMDGALRAAFVCFVATAA